MEYLFVWVTAPDMPAAEKIARGLLEKKLAACCNIVGGVRSLYWWQGKIADDAEVLVVLKTTADLFERLEQEVKALHSYSVPQIVAVPVARGSEDYLRWVRESLKG